MLPAQPPGWPSWSCSSSSLLDQWGLHHGLPDDRPLVSPCCQKGCWKAEECHDQGNKDISLLFRSLVEYPWASYTMPQRRSCLCTDEPKTGSSTLSLTPTREKQTKKMFEKVSLTLDMASWAHVSFCVPEHTTLNLEETNKLISQLNFNLEMKKKFYIHFKTFSSQCFNVALVVI